MAGFTIQYGEEYYRIVGPNGEEGEPTDIGSPAFLEIGGQMYMAFVDVDPEVGEGELPDPETQREPVPATVYALGSPQVTRYKEAEFDMGDEGEDEGDEDEEEDGEDQEEGDPEDQDEVDEPEEGETVTVEEED